MGQQLTSRVQVIQPPFIDVLWDVLVLDADHLLPLNQPLPILSKFELLSDSTQRSQTPIWKLYGTSNNSLVERSSSGDPLPPFQHTTLRPIPLRASPLLMVINARQKIADYMTRSGSILPVPRLHQFLLMLTAVTEEIWFEPVPAPGSVGAELAAIIDEAETAEKPCRAENDSEDVLVEQHGSEEDFMDLDGLTNKEWEALNQVLDNPRSSTRARVEAGQMLLFGVDGELF